MQSSKFDTALCKLLFYYHCFVPEILFFAQINEGFQIIFPMEMYITGEFMNMKFSKFVKKILTEKYIYLFFKFVL